MVVVEVICFDSYDYVVETQFIPCDNKETAKAVANKAYEKMLEHNWSFKNDDERQKWEEENVMRYEDGSIDIDGSDCGYGKINIKDVELVTANTASSVEVSACNIF